MKIWVIAVVSAVLGVVAAAVLTLGYGQPAGSHRRFADSAWPERTEDSGKPRGCSG